jgi:phage gp46-like protein
MLKIIPVDDEREPYRSPDLLWDGLSGDLDVNALTHPTAPGDLRAEQGIATQVLICLMTDRRVEPEELRDGDQNRGWLGDSFDIKLGETPIGSRLWLLRRAAIFEGIEVTVEDYIREALQPLLDQRAVVSIDVNVTVDRARNRIDYGVVLHGKRGERIFDRQFELLWRQADAVVYPLSR